MSQAVAQSITDRYRETFPNSAKLAERGRDIFPNGVTHDGRHLKPFPIYAERAEGSKKYDVDGHAIIDYWMGHGAMLLGHGYPSVVEAVRDQVGKMTHPGACHELEIEWAERIRDLTPSVEQIRFTNSGTEATLMALRVARIVSGRTKVLKFAGHFHGWHDQVIPAAEPPHDVDYSVPGVSDSVMGDLIIVPPHDLAAVERAIDEHQPACILHEGNGARWGFVPARADYLRALADLAARKQTIFILDEVITGFRVHPNSFQGACGVRPDLTTMAKVVAGGLPGGCLGGRRDLMQALAYDNPLGKKMKHPGTYNGNPLSAAAGIEALKVVATGEPARHANEMARLLRAGLNAMFAEKNATWVAYGDYSAIKIHPEYDGPRPDSDDFIPYGNDFRKLDVKYDAALSHAFRCALLLGGVDWMGWGGSTSLAHTKEDIQKTITAYADALDMLRADGLTR